MPDKDIPEAIMDEAARIYGFVGGMPDIVTLAQRQVELIERIACALALRDRYIDELRARLAERHPASNARENDAA